MLIIKSLDVVKVEVRTELKRLVELSVKLDKEVNEVRSLEALDALELLLDFRRLIKSDGLSDESAALDPDLSVDASILILS
jgi:hypothetical protein